jgi:hypothetical protein
MEFVNVVRDRHQPGVEIGAREHVPNEVLPLRPGTKPVPHSESPAKLLIEKEAIFPIFSEQPLILVQK